MCPSNCDDERSQDTVLIDRKSIKVDAGATLRVVLPKNEIPTEIIPQNIPLKILYEDEYMIVINKDAGMVVVSCMLIKNVCRVIVEWIYVCMYLCM